MKQIIILAPILIAISLCSCHKETTSVFSPGSVIIIDQGGYNHGNADLSVYNPNTKAISNNVFSQENGFALGDVAQSLYLIGDTAYIVMNNSKRVVVANASQNFKYITSISLPNASPRYFLPVDGRRAYVTELYANKIWIVDYRADTLIKSISVTGWTEQVASWNGKIYVEEATTPSSTYGTGSTSPPVHAVLMIDPLTDQIANTVSLQSDPASMVLTTGNKLFVLSPQQTSPIINASLYEIDMPSFSIEKQINFSASRVPNYIAYSSVSNQILYSDIGGIFAMQLTDTVIPATPYIASPGWAAVYGLNANPSNGDIYVCDAVDYQQASHIWRYSQSGSLVDNFNAGIISCGCVFE